MCSHSDRTLAVFLLAGAALTGCRTAEAAAARAPAERPAATRTTGARDSLPPAGVLRVCADPNNLPFSNSREEGFENRIAQLIARDLGERVAYTWQPQRRGFVRTTLNAHRCDLIMGVPAGYDLVLASAPYYRSTYVFVTRRDHGPRIHSFDDPALRRLRIGVHLIGDDYANPPPVDALAARGIRNNVVGYPIFGDYSKPDPPADLIRAVEHDSVDVAIVWGPLGGYFAKRSSVPLVVTPVADRGDTRAGSMQFSIAMGVRHGDTALRRRVQASIARHRRDIREILDRYGVPVVPAGPEGRR
jgi:quinoprotein dehydrogenase-associated probable ABC transporter substrate-binding protein